MILILEDQIEKAAMVLLKLQEEFGHQPIFITGYVASAEEFIERMDNVTLVLDGELHPGAGFGPNFLQWCLKEPLIRHKIRRVIINTGSLMMRNEMETLCQKAQIAYKVLNALL